MIRPAGSSGSAEQQVQRDRRADELGQVGRHRDQLGLDPQPERDAAREVLAAQLGQVPAGRDADLGRQVLDQHRHQVRGEDHPQQQVAELRRRRRCWWRSCRGRRTRSRPRTPGRATAARRGRARGGACPRTPGRSATATAASCVLTPASTRIAPASDPPRTCTSSPKRTNSGPSNGCFSTTSNASPGAIPRSAEVAEHLGVGVGDRARTPARAGLGGREALGGLLLDHEVGATGSGRRAGRASDARAWRRSAPRAPPTARARAPRPRRARGPTARRGSRPGTARAAGGGGSPRAPRASPSAVSCDALVRHVLDQPELVELADHARRRSSA